ncbi:MAG: acylneuraminate cytidylyltransferase family protein [Candidatus Omnitrophica bacterium]|nr:acylneuraminate cytidylyltransferase family protein [Candidatus Omnitrophota bacterium]
MPEPKILLTIAARGGSKGVKNKNIRMLCGKPLMAHTILQAKKWGKAAHIVVSTDSSAIAAVAKKFGAEVPFMRPPALASDTAGKVPVIRHALSSCEKIFGVQYDMVVDLDATAPIRTIQDLDTCLELFLKKMPSTIFSVVPAHKSPYFNMIEINKQGRVVLCKRPGKRLLRRQDAPAVYDANASIYFYDRDYLLRAKAPSPINPRCCIYVMPDVSGFDIDREVDFKFLEFLVKEGVVCL